MLKLNTSSPAGLDLTASKFITIPDRIAERFSIREDDLFICWSIGSYDQVAKYALAKEDAPSIVFPDIMIRVRLNYALLPAFVREVAEPQWGQVLLSYISCDMLRLWLVLYELNIPELFTT
jgi:hypothetical protein